MKRLGLMAVIALGGLVVFGPLATAQEKPEAKKSGAGQTAAMMGERINRMKEELGLTDEQVEKVKATLKDQAEKIREMRQDANATPEQRREKFQAMQEEQNKKLKEILKPEQYEKWQKMRDDLRNRFPKAGSAKEKSPEKKKDSQ